MVIITSLTGIYIAVGFIIYNFIFTRNYIVRAFCIIIKIHYIRI